YSALSYCWGSQDRTRPIICDNASFRVTANLESALKRLRATDIARDFWIDQICIDQENLTEKSQQLSLIGAIYQRSNKLLVWLGDEGDDNGDLTQQGRENINVDQLKSHGLPSAKDTAWQDLRSLLSRPWFSRIWTIQEAAFATKT
ncbi:heterokaryon incompatibility, partial [Usnea florida]